MNEDQNNPGVPVNFCEEIDTPNTHSEQTQLFTDTITAQVQQGSTPGRILYTAEYGHLQLNKFDGEIEAAPMKQGLWANYYANFQSAAPNLPEWNAVNKRLEAHQSRGLVPLALADFSYHKPTRRALARWRRSIRGVAPMAAPANPAELFEESSYCALGAFLPDRWETFGRLPHVHRGLKVRFILPADLIFSNMQAKAEPVSIDFGDGLGARKVALDEAVEVVYGTPGEKTITAVIPADTGERTAIAVFAVSMASPAPTPDETWTLTADFEYPVGSGFKAKGVAYVYYGLDSNNVKRTSLAQPVLIGDGFPGHSLDDLYELANQLGTMGALSQHHYDVVLVSYSVGTDYIQRNAFVYAKAISTALGKIPAANQLICGGASMGGLIARYALAYMHANSLPNRTKMYFSLDTPHRGANIASSVQYFVKKLDSLGKLPVDAAPIVDLLNSMGARQMLVYFYAVGQGVFRPPEYTAFQAELAALEGGALCGGVPVYFISNGTIAAQPSQQPAYGSLAVDWHGNCCANGSAWAFGVTLPPGVVSAGPYPVAAMTIGTGAYGLNITIPVPPPNIDGAPGGTRSSWAELAASLNLSGYGTADNPIPDHCFVPLRSSLNLDNSDPYAPVTPASNMYASSDAASTGHAVMTAPMQAYLLGLL